MEVIVSESDKWVKRKTCPHNSWFLLIKCGANHNSDTWLHNSHYSNNIMAATHRPLIVWHTNDLTENTQGAKCASLLNMEIQLKGIFQCKFNQWSNKSETVLYSVSRDKVCWPLANIVLASSETTPPQQYIAVIGSKYKTAIKKPQIMLRKAPNFSNIRNMVPAHISRHQTFDIVAVFVGKYKWNSPPEKPSLLWGSPVSRLPSAVESCSNDHHWTARLYCSTHSFTVLDHGLNLHLNIPLTFQVTLVPNKLY